MLTSHVLTSENLSSTRGGSGVIHARVAHVVVPLVSARVVALLLVDVAVVLVLLSILSRLLLRLLTTKLLLRLLENVLILLLRLLRGLLLVGLLSHLLEVTLVEELLVAINKARDETRLDRRGLRSGHALAVQVADDVHLLGDLLNSLVLELLRHDLLVILRDLRREVY